MTLAKPTERLERLHPDVFRLPVDKIRDGYYTDAYFNFTKELLEAEDRHPNVAMQVFQNIDDVDGRYFQLIESVDQLLEPLR